MADVSAFYPSLVGKAAQPQLVTERGNKDLLSRQMETWEHRMRSALASAILESSCFLQISWQNGERFTTHNLLMAGANETDAEPERMQPLAAAVRDAIVRECRVQPERDARRRPHLQIVELTRHGGDQFSVRFNVYPRSI